MSAGFAARLLGAAMAWAIVTMAPAAMAETPLQRGTYLMRGIVACGNCHTPKGPDGTPLADQELAGGFVIDLPVFRAVASNITPDKETGIGSWTDQEIIDAIRNGRRPDGTIIGPPMPIEFYRSMSDRDVRAIVAYLRAVRPVRNQVAASSYRIPLPPTYGPTVTQVAAPPAGTGAAYGRYLADIAHCMECHTPAERGRLVRDKWGAGGRELPAVPDGVIVSPNLTPANPDGIAHWSDAQVKAAIQQGVRADGRKLVPLMAFDWYRTVDARDMDALVAYLRTLKPAQP